MKTCTRCKVEKEDYMFKVIKDKRINKPYRVAVCKKCESDYNNNLQKKKYSTNPEWRAQKRQQEKDRRLKLKTENLEAYEQELKKQREYYTKVYYPKNKEKVLNHTKEYGKTEKSKQQKRIYVEKNRERLNMVKKEYRKNMADRYIVSLIFNSDRRSPGFNKEQYKNFNNKYLIQLYKTNLLIKKQIYGNSEEKNQKHEGLD